MARRCRIACALIIALASLTASPSAGQQTSPPRQPRSAGQPAPTGLILGRVVDAVTGQRIGGATVSYFSEAREGGEILTDDAGRFVIASLPAGMLSLTARKNGHFDAWVGQRRPDEHEGSGMMLRDGERRGDVVLHLWKRASIEGRVVDEHGEPVVGVTVSAFPKTYVAGRPAVGWTRQPHGAETDDRGQYRISGLMPGDYIVALPTSTNVAPVSVVDAYNQLATRDPKRRTLDAAFDAGGVPGSRPGSPRTVRIGDFMRSIERMPVPLEPRGQGAASPASLLVYPTAYHPGVASIDDATVVVVGAGAEVGNVDLTLRPVRTAGVSGTVRKPDGPAAHMALHLLPADSGDWTVPLPIARTMTDGGGGFTFLGVPPGSYRIELLKAPPTPGVVEGGFIAIMSGSDGGVVVSTDADDRTPPPPPDPSADEMWWGTASVTVADADVRGVVLDLAQGARVSGRIVVPEESTSESQPRRTTYEVTLERADGRDSAFTMSSEYGRTLGYSVAEQDLTFRTRPLPPGKYLLRVGAKAVKSAMAGGRNIAEVPLDLGTHNVTGVVVTLLDPGATVNGSVRAANGPLPQGLAAIVFPTDRAGWSDFGRRPQRIRAAAVDVNGRYEIAGLTAGEYYVATVDRTITAHAVHPGLLGTLARQATRVTLTEGHTRAVDIVVR